MSESKRKVDLAVISDIHLGTPGCHAKELLSYLRSIKPKTLVLNGDIIDMWQFKKRYWPKPHMKVIKYFINLSTKGTEIFYITGNHDETLRKFAGMSLGSISIVNQLVLDLNGTKAWLFHGDVFDVIMQNSKWLAKLGSLGYDLLIRLNQLINFFSLRLISRKVSLSKKIKDNVKTALKYIDNFEITAAQLAIRKGYDLVICGHIHKPEMRTIADNKGNSIRYLNSGDWIENLSALEYKKGKWKIYRHPVSKPEDKNDADDASERIDGMDNKEIFNQMLKEFRN
jgi:UDP-2,3-diacylglucosamine pyrophosphatase LpxH